MSSRGNKTESGVKPNTIFKFDYLSYGITRVTAQIKSFMTFRECFPDTVAMARFLEVFIDAITSDFGVAKSFYDAECFDDDEEDPIPDDPSSKTIPMEELTNTGTIPKFIKMLKRNGRENDVLLKYTALAKYLKSKSFAKNAVESLIKIISEDSFYIIKNKDTYPVIDVNDSFIPTLMRKVIYKNFRRSEHEHRRCLLVMRNLMKESSMRKINDTHSEKTYHHKMVAVKTMEGGMMLFEESKKKVIEDTTGLSINFVALPSFKTSYNFTGINMWESITSASKIKLIRCLIPGKNA